MGLDQYLYKKRFIRYNEHEKLIITGIEGIHADRVTGITEEVGYWRKANAIHKWFVDHVQEGNDDCGEYEVSNEQLQELLDTVIIVLNASELIPGDVQNRKRWIPEEGLKDVVEKGKIIKNSAVAEKFLPCQSGFFFGGTGYDEYYVRDLEHTKEIITEALTDTNSDYYYSSSW